MLLFPGVGAPSSGMQRPGETSDPLPAEAAREVAAAAGTGAAAAVAAIEGAAGGATPGRAICGEVLVAAANR